MSAAVMASGYRSGDSADAATARAGKGAVLCAEKNTKGTGLELVLKPGEGTSKRAFSEPRLDHLIEELHRHSHDPDALRCAAGAMRRTVETSLWQSAHGTGSRLPAIHAGLLGPAVEIFATEKLRRLSRTLKQWLVLLSSPQRILWAVQAAWKGEAVIAFVSERASWHSVDEIAVYQRDRETPIVRVGPAVATDEEEWLASNPVFSVSKRYLAGERRPDVLPAAMQTDEPPVQTMVVIGEKSEITARITGHPPLGMKEELHSLSEAADVIVADTALSRAEWVSRLKELVTPALKKTGPHIAEKFWNPLVILAVVLIAGAALLSSAGVQHLKWEGVVKQLDSEPGIEVISHSLAWGHRELELFRDPLARPVRELLRQMGCNPGNVTIRELSYVSAEEPLQAARQLTDASYTRQVTAKTLDAREQMAAPPKPANKTENTAEIQDRVLANVRLDMFRSALELPDDLDLSLAGGELTAHGVLSEPAYSRLATAPRKFSWIKKINLEQVRDLTAENIAELQKGLEKMQIEFVPTSAILPEASKLRLQSVASEMGLLAGDARVKQLTVRVQFRVTDPGIDTVTIGNRVDTVRQVLERQGVPAAWFTPAMDVLEAPGLHAIAFRINLEPSATEP